MDVPRAFVPPWAALAGSCASSKLGMRWKDPIKKGIASVGPCVCRGEHAFIPSCLCTLAVCHHPSPLQDQHPCGDTGDGAGVLTSGLGTKQDIAPAPGARLHSKKMQGRREGCTFPWVLKPWLTLQPPVHLLHPQTPALQPLHCHPELCWQIYHGYFPPFPCHSLCCQRSY